MTVRIGRTLAGRLLHKLVGGVNRLCTTCCPPATGCCDPTRRPSTMTVTVVLTAGADLCGWGGKVITVFNATPGSAISHWTGTTGGGPIYEADFFNDCILNLSAGAPCDFGTTFVSGACSTNTYTYTATNLGSTYTIVVTP